ncbi:MAG: type 1 glutamine amidotransferase domain-containing protein [Pseudomonadota bacterium]
MKILMVLTSHDRLGNTGRPTGFWLEEFTGPYYVFRDAGMDVTLVSPKGGQPPIDPRSDDRTSQTDSMTRFKNDPATQMVLASTGRLDLADAAGFEAVFYPGGHGPMWDLVDHPKSISLIEAFYDSGRPVAAVCHAPAVLHRVVHDGQPLVRGRRVTGFTNSEEEAVGLTGIVPFLVEDELKRLGAFYQKSEDWADFTVVDGQLVTGQNPASSASGARKLLQLLTS